jgi:hypothetical protein
MLHMTLRRILRSIAALMILCAITDKSVMSRQAGSGDSQSPQRLQICLHNHFGNYGYTYAELLERSRSEETTACVAVFTERDILKYRMSEKPSGRVELQLTAEASSRIARKREGIYKDVCEEGLFTITLDGKSLYRGQCYLRIGAAALRYPVMHIESGNDGTMALRIGSYQGVWAGMQAPDSSAIERIDPPQLREFFRQLGKLEIMK